VSDTSEIIQPPPSAFSAEPCEQFCPEPLLSISDGWDPLTAVTVDVAPTKVSGELPRLSGVAELRYRLDIEDAEVTRSAIMWEFVMPVRVPVGGDVEL